MSQENVELVREVYEQFARGDFSWMAEVADDYVYVPSPENPDGGTYRGEAASRWLQKWVASFEGLTVEATEIIDAGDKVVVGMLQRSRPHGSQAAVEGHWWHVVTLRDGVVIRGEMFPERAQAVEAAGLRE